MIIDEQERLKKIEAALSRIERGLFGEQDLEHWGLVQRVANHGKRLRRLEVWLATLITAGGTISLLYKVATDWVAR